MKILDYETFNFRQPTLTEVLGELLPVYNLELYQNIGEEALTASRISDAIVWFTKGLAMARDQRNRHYIELFKELILENLEVQ
jgi:hypothetical protein